MRGDAVRAYGRAPMRLLGAPGDGSRVMFVAATILFVVFWLTVGFWSLATQLAFATAAWLVPWVLPGRLRATSGFDPLPFVGTVSFLNFAGGALTLQTVSDVFPALEWHQVIVALFWSTLGWFSCVLGYSVVGAYAARRPRRLRADRTIIDWERVVPAMIVLGLMSRLGAPYAPPTLVAMLTVYAGLCPAGIGFAAYLFARERRQRDRWLAWILLGVGAWLLLTVPESQREPIVLPFILMAIGYRLGTNRPYPRVAVVAVFVIGAVTLRGLGVYKAERWSGQSVSVAMEAAVAEAAAAEPMEYVAQSITLAGQRFNYLGTVATIMELTPAVERHLEGETYALFFWAMFVPRFLVPDKPTLGIYNDVAKRYGLVGQDDYNTSIALPPVAELFLNFGYEGILVGMFAYGMLYSILHLWLHGGARISDISVLVYVAVAYHLARGDIFAMTMANVVKLMAGVAVMVLLLAATSRPAVRQRGPWQRVKPRPPGMMSRGR